MREIKFRGKREEDGEWQEGYFVFGLIEDLIVCGLFSWRVKSETVGEYTGLEDKNGKKIFEGDILRVKSRKTETLCVVVFREGWFIGITEDNGECEFRYMADVEIIGNIYDNPDLIKIRPPELKEED